MSYDPAPLSKTAKYKKITKPLLERKRRARINRCLDELKDLMVGALEIDDDNLSKLEKADILELTVNHITKLHSPKDPVMEAKKFQAGFGQCAAEACRFIMSVPDLDAKVGRSLIDHLSRLVAAQPLTVQVPERFSPPVSPSSIASDRQHYCSDLDRSSSDDAEDSYSADGGGSWSQGAGREIPPVGLLTTIDKLPVDYRYGGDERRDKGTEAKETILQKIRQHIMEKRVNEVHNIPERRQETPSTLVYPQSDTLDLRKVRSPTKYQEKRTATQAKAPRSEDLERGPRGEETTAPASAAVGVPEQCQLPMDYNSLPPKKKRKLLEYQEHKKLEEARRRDAFYEHKKQYSDGPPAAGAEDGSAWRPW